MQAPPLEDEFHAKLNDAGRDGSVGGSGLRAERCRRQQAADHTWRGDAGGGVGSGEGILCGVDGEDVVAVEHVEGLQDQLKFHGFPEGKILGDARIEADVPREIKRVSAEARESSGAGVAVVIQVSGDERAIGLAGLGGKDAAQLPASEEEAGSGGHTPGVRVEIADATDNKSIPLVVLAGGAVGAGKGWELDHLGIVEGAGNDGGGVGIVVNDVAPSVGSRELKALAEALVQLDREAVVNGVGGPLKLLDAVERGDWPRAVARNGDRRRAEQDVGRADGG